MIPKDMPDVIDQRIRPTGILRALPGAARRARWWLAHCLWAAVVAILERERRAQPIAVYGPGGQRAIMSRGMAEDMAAAGKLRRASDDVMREELGLPPRIVADVSSDHTNLAGALDPAPTE